MSRALSIINKRVGELQRKHPNAKRVTLQRRAGKEYKAGVIGKIAKRKRKPVPKKTLTHNRGITTVITRRQMPSVRRGKSFYTTTVTTRKRSIGGIDTNSILLLGALAVGGYFLFNNLNKPAAALPAVMTTGNPQRDNNASSLLQWAQVAGLGLAAITALVNALNSKSDSDVKRAADSVASGQGLPSDFLYV